MRGVKGTNPPCSVSGCPNRTLAKRLCGSHYRRMQRHGDPLARVEPRYPQGPPCRADGCERPSRARGYCSRHYERVRRTGEVGPAGLLRGAGYLSEEGYRVISVVGRPVFQHRWVMEQVLDRRLRRDEVVHHKNGMKLDNRPENLELCVKRHPPGQRVVDLVVWAREILAQYGDEFPAEIS